MMWNKAVFCLEVLIHKRLQLWRHNYVIDREEWTNFYIGGINCFWGASTVIV